METKEPSGEVSTKKEVVTTKPNPESKKEKEWYYLDPNDDNKQKGPVSRKDFEKLNLGHNAMVWSEGMPQWKTIASLWEQSKEQQDQWYWVDKEKVRHGPVGKWTLSNVLIDEDPTKVQVWRALSQEWKTWKEWKDVINKEEKKAARLLRDATKQAFEEKKNKETIQALTKKAVKQQLKAKKEMESKKEIEGNTPKQPEEEKESLKKRELEEDSKSSSPKAKRQRKNPEKYKRWKNVKNLKTVYVSGLPKSEKDWNLAKFVEVFRKIGIVAQDAVTNLPKAKLYRDKVTNQLNGDGILTYFHEMSANMAILLKNGATIQGKQIKVERAKFKMKGKVYKSGKKFTMSEKKVHHEKFVAGKQQRVPHLKICILKNMFRPDMASQDPEGEAHFYQELKKEILVEVMNIGKPKKITVFQGSPFGAVAVNFRRFEDASKLIESMKGRYFGGQLVECDY